MDTGLTWQEAKASTQEMELEIAGLVPEEVVAGIEQMEKGTPFSCRASGQRAWLGATTVTVMSGTEIEPIVRMIEEHYRESRFDSRTRLNVSGNYEVQLIARGTSENYIVAEGFEPDEIRIASGSECFTLPEDVYPGGEF